MCIRLGRRRLCSLWELMQVRGRWNRSFQSSVPGMHSGREYINQL